ncbi:hypothetical protein AV530_005164 [Patagioenas fasciata monilis]|uniref:Uncharacterized protein n=1 Tax=Patagioenas fasciata monilis TaxID=372326 RepID=A0A1V4K4H1_PATFA|nr:hypothetical protein AV530_005164 [Patagioenas fasciata monilis]
MQQVTGIQENLEWCGQRISKEPSSCPGKGQERMKSAELMRYRLQAVLPQAPAAPTWEEMLPRKSPSYLPLQADAWGVNRSSWGEEVR